MVEVRDLIRQLGTDGRTILLCSHLLNEVEQVCDNVAILSHGRLVIQGSVQDLLGQKDVVRLTTTDDEKAAQVIGSLSWVSDVRTEDGVLVVTASSERSWELTQELSQQGVYVSTMTRSQASLESYFLEITGEDASPDEEEAP